MRTMPRGFSGETRRNGRKGGRKRDDDDTVGKENDVQPQERQRVPRERRRQSERGRERK